MFGASKRTRTLSTFPAGLLGPQPVARATEPTLPDYRNATAEPQQQGVDPAILSMVGSAPVKRNNTGRDVIAGLLSVVGSALARNSGNEHLSSSIMSNFTNGIADRRAAFHQAQQDYEARSRIAQLPGMTQREFAGYLADPKAWGGHMSDAAVSRYQAATLNPGDTRFLGDGNGSIQAPTRGEQYARALGLGAGTEPYNNAIRDQELGANGPTAFGNNQTLETLRSGNRTSLEALRQRNRLGLEGARQGNRMGLRSAPTYRDLNPPPPRAPAPRAAPRAPARPTATGPNGQRIEWNGSAWVPIR